MAASIKVMNMMSTRVSSRDVTNQMNVHTQKQTNKRPRKSCLTFISKYMVINARCLFLFVGIEFAVNFNE